jgi:hypothetical protein
MLGYHALLDNLQRFLVTFLGMSMCLIMNINAHNNERQLNNVIKIPL